MNTVRLIIINSGYSLSLSAAIPKGGNEAHLAPEILNERCGRNKSLNYSKQPVWAAGVLAYELAGHQNPFYGSEDQRAYDERNITKLTATFSKVGVWLVRGCGLCKGVACLGCVIFYLLILH